MKTLTIAPPDLEDSGLQFKTGIESAWNSIAEIAPKIVAAVLVFVIGMFIAKLIRKAVTGLLRKTGVDAAVAKTGLGKSLSKSGGTPTRILVQIMYAGLVLMVAQIAIGMFGTTPVSEVLNQMIGYIPKVVVALLIVLLTGWVVDLVTPIVRDVTADKKFQNMAVTAVKTGVWLIGGFAALDQVEIASNIVDTLFQTIVGSLGAIIVLKFGLGGVWAARDRFWPAVYDSLGSSVAAPKTAATTAQEAPSES